MADTVKSTGEEDEKHGNLSLQQAILAPLDAIFMAQVHAARSFMNLVGQVGYPHVTKSEQKKTENESAAGNNANDDKEDLPYLAEFKYTAPDPLNPGKSKNYMLKIPQLALVPLNPLAIESANFKLGFRFSGTTPHQQTRPAEMDRIKKNIAGSNSPNGDLADAKTPPWALVQNPVDLKGTITSNSGDGKDGSDTVIDIEIKVSKTAMPNALDKLLATLSAAVTIEEK